MNEHVRRTLKLKAHLETLRIMTTIIGSTRNRELQNIDVQKRSGECSRTLETADVGSNTLVEFFRDILVCSLGAGLQVNETKL